MGKLLRAITDDGFVKAFVFDSTDVVLKAQKIHKLSNVATAALGRTLTAAVLMAGDLKNDKDRVSIQIKSDGEIGNIVSECYKTGEVKGFVSNGDVNIPLRADGKLDVAGALGHSGSLSVVKDLGMSEPQTGTVELVSGEIAQDISYYYMQSEQIPTVIGLGVLVSKDGVLLGAGGYMVQLLPDHTEEVIDKIEKNATELPKSVSLFFAEDKDPKILMDTVLKDMPYKILEESEGSYKCDCSRYRVEKAVISLGKKEIAKMIEEEKSVEVECHYCKKNYTLEAEDLKILLNIAK